MFHKLYIELLIVLFIVSYDTIILKYDSQRCLNFRLKMLPVDPSPSKEKQVKSQRILEWVSKSDLAVYSISKSRRKRLILTPKRKHQQNENNHDSIQLAKRAKADSPSKALSPKKFYLPSNEVTTTVYFNVVLLMMLKNPIYMYCDMFILCLLLLYCVFY